MLASRRSLIMAAQPRLSPPRLNRGFAQPANAPYKLDPLPYPPNKNEPYIDAQRWRSITTNTRRLCQQSQRRHRSAARSRQAAVARTLTDLAACPSRSHHIRNNGGGHANHTMFWQIMGGPGASRKANCKPPSLAIRRARQAAGPVQRGRRARIRVGWCRHRLKGWQARARNQAKSGHSAHGRPTRTDGQRRGEHAYDLKYQNRRPDYLKAWWNIVNWDKVSERYSAAKSGRADQIQRRLARMAQGMHLMSTLPRPWLLREAIEAMAGDRRQAWAEAQCMKMQGQ